VSTIGEKQIALANDGSDKNGVNKYCRNTTYLVKFSLFSVCYYQIGEIKLYIYYFIARATVGNFFLSIFCQQIVYYYYYYYYSSIFVLFVVFSLLLPYITVNKDYQIEHLQERKGTNAWNGLSNSSAGFVRFRVSTAVAGSRATDSRAAS